ncbi:hypothetical protein J7J13_03730 [bacterium]|nr:hypothetical protein [bacterium]
MELKEYIAIFKKHFALFLLTAILSAAAIIVSQALRPSSCKVSLALNITRGGFLKTDDYRYDDFYRLQADERFADTVARWITLPGITADIYDEAGVNGNKKFKAKRLSSQIVEIVYTASDAETARKLSDAVVKVLNRETEKLNEPQKNEAWFKILGSRPIIIGHEPDWRKTALIGMLIGIFLGFWAALIKHYLE